MTMIRKVKKAARPLTIGIATLLCAASALVALAVLLAFLTQHSDALHALFSSQRIAAIGIALLLVAVSVLVLEAPRNRPIKRVLATAALFCAAGGAVMVWTGFDHTPSVESHGGSVAQGSPRSGSGWKPRHGSGKAGSNARGGKSHLHDHATPGSVKASDELSSEGETEQASSSSSPYCGCDSSEGGYVPPQQESWSPEPSPEYGSSQSRSEESWGDEESWGEEEEWEVEEDWGEEEWEEEEWGE
jgi:hypothetical protein